MKILTKEKWYLFKDDGKLFESLVEELLHAKYPDADFINIHRGQETEERTLKAAFLFLMVRRKHGLSVSTIKILCL